MAVSLLLFKFKVTQVDSSPLHTPGSFQQTGWLSTFFAPHQMFCSKSLSSSLQETVTQALGFQSSRTQKQEETFVELNYLFIRKAPTPHSWKLLEFYLPQAYDLQPKTLCKESKD